MNCRNTKYIVLEAGPTGGGDTTMDSESMLRPAIGKTKGKIKYTAIVTVGGTKIFT